ncbi:efflux RND transporter permease subunit [Novosphingobium sp. 1949]|uniref:Efflux pump membrane transporter n=1 Tax=Novosphingobium organovorum TaxID=2930092 RepID=A0ABT0BCA4_9SPHN|nr:efflux RND transporter permease subunit [Novosphingobium organovorum]
MSRFFVDRPIFAYVLAIVVMMAGGAAIMSLPIAQYPDVAPPSVSISATYTGASAATLESSVTQVIEQQLTGIDNMLYFSSTSDSSGKSTVTVTFAKGTDPDVAQVQVQNKVQQANSRLPTSVQQQGLTVTKSNSDMLMIVGVYDSTDKASSSDVSDYLVSNMQDQIARVSGVGDIRVFGAEHAMRIWLDPAKLDAVQLMPSDVEDAISAQNVDLSAGQIGALPAVKGQQLNAVVKAKSRLQTVDQFRNIVVKTNTDGSVVHLSDVADVEMGQSDYTSIAKYNGHPASGMGIELASGADALATSEAVKARVAELASTLPTGYKVTYPKDSSIFVRLSVHEVAETLFIAIILVILVMYVFLQSWRATIVPALAVPVVLLGTFGMLAVFGYSINTLTLFGMVLAIGLLVDDAIVVVENVERLMEEENLSPRDATIKSMGEIGSALIGIAVVLSAVLLPMAFFGGSTGVIYRQFSVTIVSAMVLSVLTALVLSPALCATILRASDKIDANRPVPSGDEPEYRGFAGRVRYYMTRFFIAFDRTFVRLSEAYLRRTNNVIARRGLHMGVFAVICVAVGVLFVRLPTGFLPVEDQGELMVMYQLPAGATNERTEKVRSSIIDYMTNKEKETISGLFTVAGFSFNGSGQNAGMGFVAMKPFDERTKTEQSATALAMRTTIAMSKERDAQVFAMVPPAVQGLGQSNGFTFELLNNSGMSDTAFKALRDKIIAAASRDPSMSQVRAATLPDTPQLQITFDDAKLAVLGLTESDATDVLSTAWGGTYVNDFVDNGRVKKVYLQGDAPSRMLPSDLDRWFVRSSSATNDDGTSKMVPFSSFTTMNWVKGANSISRFNGYPSYEIQGQPASGYSSGDVMKKMIALQEKLAPGTTYAWSGMSYQENQSNGQQGPLYILSIIVVFLSLAALYESWSVPLAVMLVIPLGILGAVLAVSVRGLENNIYFQVGLLTTVGLAAKNAILIVEFAEMAHREGKDMVHAAMEAAKVRLRPILMTSIAFIAGVFPLAVATGAGANSRIAIGTAVLGGMISATFLAIFYVPMFFVVVAKLFHRGDDDVPQPAAGPGADVASTPSSKDND